MRLLLDTHTLLWFCEGNPALSASARKAIEDRTNERYVSHVTAWEVALKLAVGKLQLQVPYATLFSGVLLANGFGFLLPDFPHFEATLTLPFHHRDPFDRLLNAQPMTERMTLISCDPHMAPYGVSLLW
jgi:PIN domain nuclease of toxin-antitoxin system